MRAKQYHYTVSQVATLANVHEETVRRDIRCGDLEPSDLFQVIKYILVRNPTLLRDTVCHPQKQPPTPTK